MRIGTIIEVEIHRTVVQPSLTVSHELNLDLGDRRVRLERLRLADQDPFMIELSYLPL